MTTQCMKSTAMLLVLTAVVHAGHVPDRAAAALVAEGPELSRGLRALVRENQNTQARLSEALRLQVDKKAPEERKTAAKKAAVNQPVNLQMSTEEIERFLSKLSPKCNEQFAKMLAGNGSALHTFGTPGVAPTEDICKSLKGNLCRTTAFVAQQQAAPDGRLIKSTVDVEGKGCLPENCLSGADLTLLAGLMREKATLALGSKKASVRLDVDCTMSGGSYAVVGSGTSRMAAPSTFGLVAALAVAARLLL